MTRHEPPTAFVADAPALTGLRFVQVLDDHSSPTIRRRDFVLLAHTDRYIGEGYYLISNAFDEPASYYCTGFGESREKPIRLVIENKLYRSEPEAMSKAEFGRLVIGKVAMTCRVQDHSLIDHQL